MPQTNPAIKYFKYFKYFIRTCRLLYGYFGRFVKARTMNIEDLAPTNSVWQILWITKLCVSRDLYELNFSQGKLSRLR